MRLTRWQSFSQRHRNRPLKRWLYQISFVLALCLYAYAFFVLQPDRSHDTIEALNAALQEQARIEQADRTAKRIRAQEIGQQDDENNNNNNDEKESQKKNKSNDRILDLFLFSYAISLAMRLSSRPRNSREARRQRRLQFERRRERFRQWAERLNAQRQANGQQPISLSSLELVMQERDMTGEDYDRLLQFDEEAGPAMQALLSGIGASQEEIDRCPMRTLGVDDELLMLVDDGRHQQQCAICLEDYQIGQQVRTIPCFHSFHKDCLDPWLAHRAVCPVCKHSALA